MNDFIQYQENAEGIISQISSQIKEIEQNNDRNDPKTKSQAKIIYKSINDLENIIQSIVAESNIWSSEERRESRNYITQLRTKVTEFQTRISPFLDQTAENTAIPLNENTAEDGMDAPLIARRSDLRDDENPNLSHEETSDDSMNADVNVEQSKCILVTRIFLSILLIIAICVVLYQLYH